MIETILFPSDWILINILPDLQIIFLILDNMVMKRPLPYSSSSLTIHFIGQLRRSRFQRTQHIAKCIRNAFSLKEHKQMDVVGHDEIFINKPVKNLRQIAYLLVYNLTNREEQLSSPCFTQKTA